MSVTVGTPVSSVMTNKRRVGALKSLGVLTVGDALTYYPFRVTDPVPLRAIREARIGEPMAFTAEVRAVRVASSGARGNGRLEVVVDDSAFAASRRQPGAIARLVFFSHKKQYLDWMSGRLRQGTCVVVAGMPGVFNDQLQFTHPEVLTVGMHLFLNKSKAGLSLRAVGESPATADAAGVNVTRYKYLATVIGGGISAIGGMVYIMTIASCVWNHEALSGEGWLAVALVIFCLWRPLNAIWGSILFGALMILYQRLHLGFIPDELYKILPYVVTVIVLIFTSLRNSKDKQPPNSLGLPYFREER